MGTSVDRQPLTRIAAAFFEGLDVVAIARRLSVSRAAVEEEVEALEAVLILAAHSVPEALMARGARLSAETAAACLAEIRSRLGTAELMQAFLAARPSAPAARPGSPRRAAPRAEDDAPPTEEAEQALAVLDFWASKWL